MFKQDLTFRTPLMNAAGTLGFFPDRHAPLDWNSLGAFVTNPLSLRRRLPTARPELVEYPGGILLHTGLPNPSLPTAIKKYARRWADADLPIIVHLMADRPEETARMVQSLEGTENVLAVELGFAPLLTNDIILLSVEMCLGELPLIVSLPSEQVLGLGPRALDAGAAVLSLAAPRGALTKDAALVSGRLYGPSLFPQALETVANAAKLGLAVIGSGGVYNNENASAMLEAGALAVQIDFALWKGFNAGQ